LILNNPVKSVNFEKQLLHFFKVHVLSIAKALRTVSLIAVNAEVTVFVPSNHCFASVTLSSSVFLDLSYHTLLILIATLSVLIHAFLLRAKTKAFLLSSVQDQFVN